MGVFMWICVPVNVDVFACICMQKLEGPILNHYLFYHLRQELTNSSRMTSH